MIEVEKSNIIETTDTSLPVLVQSEDAPAFASFPDFGFAIHPDHVYDDFCLDRTTWELCGKVGTQPTLIGAFPNGKPAFDLKAMYDSSPSGGSKAVSTRTVDMREFSFVIAVNIEYSDNAPSAIGILTSAADAGLNPRIRIYEGRVFGVDGPGDAGYLKDPAPIPSGAPTVYAVTYTEGVGGKIFRGRDLVASNPANLGRTSDFLNLACLATNSFLSNVAACVFSPYYVTGVDLSKPEHTNKRAAIVHYLTQAYAGG